MSPCCVQRRMRPLTWLCLLLYGLLGSGCAHQAPVGGSPPLVRCSAAELPEFSDDMHYAGLLEALQHSIRYLSQRPAETVLQFGEDRYRALELATALEHFAAFAAQNPNPESLQAYISQRCRVYRSIGADGMGQMLFTGYYEPELSASTDITQSFAYPIYGRPEDLVQVDLSRFFSDPQRQETIYGRLEGKMLVPYPDRRAIGEQRTLAGKARILAWTDDPVGLFFLQIQGSGRLRLQDGEIRRLHYDGANGHAYRSIGKLLIERGEIPAAEISMQRIRAYLNAHPAETAEILNYNPSYVFFKEADGAPRGSLDLPLTPGRSLATDRRVFPPAALAFVETQLPQVAANGQIVQWQSARRFVLNQDTGGAIRGSGRGDLFCGSGVEAETIAGHLRHAGRLYFIVPLR